MASSVGNIWIVNPQQWASFEAHFDAIRQLPPADREAAISAIADEVVRREVASLLPHAGQSDTVAALVGAMATRVEAPHDQRFGPYRVVRRLAEGGQGAVFEGVRDDGTFHQRVAIKILKWEMEDSGARARFRMERQILANLEHPNIARMIDGGASESGIPYLVMEYVEGTSITQYCRDHKLSVTGRIELLRQVCAAVQYAHQMLVIHRDIKPGNILVTAHGVPKLLDFGIAKLLDQGIPAEGSPTQTMTAVRLLTPDYCSPEQVLGQPVSTASDVYSLGAVLYELLTRKRPHELKTYDPLEVARVVCEEPVKAPSAIGDLSLRGDLDTIVLKAMHKEPSRRYGSAESFSDDLRRYLEGRPVMARPDTIWYRTGKYVRRNRWALVAAGIAVLAIASAFVAERRQARLAADRFQIVRGLAKKLIFDVHDEVARLPGSTKPRALIVSSAIDYLDKVSRTASDDAALLAELAEGYIKVGNAQGSPGEANLGRTADSFASYDKALGLYERASALDPKYQLPLAETYFNISYSYNIARDSKNADAAMARGMSIAEGFSASHPSNQQALQMLAAANAATGDGKENSDSLAALMAYRRCRDYQAALTNLNPSETNQSRLVSAYERIGNAATAAADLDDALASLREAVRLLEPLLEAHPDSPGYLRKLALLDRSFSDLWESDEMPSYGNSAKAVEYARKYVAGMEWLVKRDPNDVSAQFSLSMALIRLSNALRLTGRPESLSAAKQALVLIDENVKRSPGNPLVTSRRARVLRRLAEASLAVGDQKAGRAAAEESLAVTRQIAAKSPDDADEQRCLALVLAAAGDSLLAAGDRTGAQKFYTEGVETARRLLRLYPRELSFVIPASRLYSSLASMSSDWRTANIELWKGCDQSKFYVQRRLKEAMGPVASRQARQ